MLYYPFANAPVPVLQQAILYWDDLATVVAPGWEARLTDRMKAVQDAGLYRPLEADQAFGPFELHEVQGELSHALKQVPHDDLIPPAEPPDGEFSTLHVGKLHKSVANELRRQDLVYPHPGNPSRLVAAPALLNIVVSLIAGRIAADNNARSGCTGPRGLRPHTDIRTAHRFNTEPTSGYDVTACWEVDLGPLLPVPRDDVMISDLVHFRTKYDAERRRLMLAVDELLHQLKQAGRHPQDAYRLVEREITEATAELKAAARGTRWGWVTRPVAAFVALAAGSGAVTEPGLEAPLTALSGAAINIATTQLRRSVAGTAQNYTYLHRTQNLVGGAG
ncbi:hypothetical protein NMK34_29465 [Micromonospora sp. BRA006-A]|uniref:DUF6236 family protein n=1 Tax=Micromonospora sp. BRA006-A TaxID=2962860 RepID=UPI00296F11EE|nr:hypothetical protein [Micromonospora sp. BRA006-A]MDW3850747.1 hypothetical protein [Micromonospora sp. BRA006-A]